MNTTLADALRKELALLESPLQIKAWETPHWASVVKDSDRSSEMTSNDFESVNVPLWGQGVQAGSGWVSMPVAARMLHAWFVDQCSVADLLVRFPDFPVNEAALVHEQGAAAYVEAAWQVRLAEVDSYPAWMRTLGPVLRAASRQPALRQLFPYTSMHRLCFSRCTGFPFSYDCPLIVPAGDWGDMSAEEFEVFFELPPADGQEHGTTRELGRGNAEAAARLAVQNLPDGCGPAVNGTWYELFGER